MWRYVKAAFGARVDVPALGRVPLNALGVFGIFILGFGEHAFWLVGMGVETAYLFTLAFNTRFQKVVEAAQHQGVAEDAELKRRNLVSSLPGEAQKRLGQLVQSCNRMLEIGRQSDDFTLDANREALQRLQWLYIKLLVAKNNLQTLAPREPEASLQATLAALEQSLQDPQASQALRDSRTATLQVTRERLANVRRRQQTLDEIDSDLTRIEAQMDLMIENATLQGKPQTISTDIELASNLFGSEVFGSSGGDVAYVDKAYRKTAGESS